MTAPRRYAPVGAEVQGEAASFNVWAPFARSVEVHITSPFDKYAVAHRDADGYHTAIVDGAGAATRYRLRLDGEIEHPDPASRSQPDGVHGDSEIVAADPGWTDAAWQGHPLRDYVIYECHIGTLTGRGTFDAAVEVLDDLVALGITALEIMPIAEFPGGRNWGYDGAYPFAAQSTYGGPDGFRRLVDACHARGIAVVLDVVYNHFGPEGCYVDAFGPYFTDRYRTPWGRAINFDGPGSDEVRRYFITNALYWLDSCHVDALRLDAVHAIADESAIPFLEELSAAVARAELGRPRYLIAESAANDARVVTPQSEGGLGIDAQWNDDFHHALCASVTGAREGYFADYGEPAQLARAYREGFVYQGERSPFRGRRHGRPSAAVPPERLVVFAHNHDQIGNRPSGDRLSTRASFEDLKLMAAAVLLSPFVPLLFMGEEYAETAPFPYFVSHTNADLVATVRRGRREEFTAFSWDTEPPDPQSEATFRSAKLDRGLAGAEPQATMRRWYVEALALRASMPAIARPTWRDATATSRTVVVEMHATSDAVVLLLNLGEEPERTAIPGDGSWTLAADSADERWRGPGSTAPASTRAGDEIEIAPRSAVLYRRETRP